VSCFAGCGKETAWTTWSSLKEATNVFLSFRDSPCQLTDANKETIEWFVVLFYDRTSTKDKVNQVQQQFFTQRGRGLGAIPPTQAAKVQHTKRTASQAVICWGQLRLTYLLTSQPLLPFPSDWGWSASPNGQQPLWKTLPDVTSSCRELVNCGC